MNKMPKGYTTDKPTQEGYYFLRYPSEPKHRFVRVFRHNGVLYQGKVLNSKEQVRQVFSFISVDDTDGGWWSKQLYISGLTVHQRKI